MQHGRSPCAANRSARPNGNDRQKASGYDDGLRTNDQHPFIWCMQVSGKPNRRIGHSGRVRRSHANALRSSHYGPMGPWSSHHYGRWQTRSDQRQ